MLDQAHSTCSSPKALSESSSYAVAEPFMYAQDVTSAPRGAADATTWDLKTGQAMTSISDIITLSLADAGSLPSSLSVSSLGPAHALCCWPGSRGIKRTAIGEEVQEPAAMWQRPTPLTIPGDGSEGGPQLAHKEWQWNQMLQVGYF